MMALRPKLGFATIPTALLLAILALPVSVVAFAVSYADNELFWPVVWMFVVLPVLWLAALVLSIRDAIKWRSWRRIAGVVALLAPTVLLFNMMLSPRFFFHQLFTFRPLDLYLPTRGFALFQKFSVCPQESVCPSRSTVTETKTIKLAKVPKGCCSLYVLNGHGKEHKVEAFHVLLNGKEVRLPPDALPQIATVTLGNTDDVTVQLTGTADAFIYVIVSYRGKKESPPARP
jgi:hypothetical protein